MKLLIVAIVIQAIGSVFYSFSCIGSEIAYFLESKYGVDWKANDVKEADLEICGNMLRNAFLPVFDELFRLFLITDLVVSALYCFILL